MAVDVLVTTELLDAVLAELTAHLPATWFKAGSASTEAYLRTMEHGDLADYCGDDRKLLDQLPALFVRPLTASVAEGGGTGAVEVIDHAFRLVHVRRFADCYTDAGALEQNMTRARERYAKLIDKALYADVNKRLDNPTLTTATGSTARIMMMLRGAWDYGTDFGGGGSPDVAMVRRLQQRGPQVWAISCDFSILVRVTPN